MKRLGRHVRAVRPDDGAKLLVQVDLIEERGVRKRLEHPSPGSPREIKLAFGAVLKSKPESVIAERLDIGYMNELRQGA